MNLKIAIVYFSGTDITKTYAQVIGGALSQNGHTPTLVNITPYSVREGDFAVADYDGFIFGFPVYADFAPRVIDTWLPTLNGQGKPCAMFFTYGGRTTGYAHYHTKMLLDKAGFQVEFTAEFLGRHSINIAGWNAVPNRPNETDFAVARDFAALAVERFSQNRDSDFNLQKPFGYDTIIQGKAVEKPHTERTWMNPVRVVDECSLCKLCEDECPTKAFDADTGMSDPQLCIECLHCVYICTDAVIKADKRIIEHYHSFLSDFSMSEDFINQKQSRLITSGLQAAF